jgi:hypothetical protein
LPDLFWYNVPKRKKICQVTIKYLQWSQNIPNGWKKCRPNGHKIYQHLPLQDPPRFTQIGIFGSKICHLATLLQVHLLPLDLGSFRSVRGFAEEVKKLAPKLDILVNNAGGTYTSSRGPFLTSPLGENFAARGEVVPQG